jgi:hypothetical protein
MKQLYLYGLLLLSLTSYTQTKSITNPNLLTAKYAGEYSYGKDIEKGIGTIYLYPETKNTILFYIELHRGAPSYNMGSLYGRVKIINNKGIFYTKFDYADNGCKWDFTFTKNSLTIKTFDNEYECGFGNAVFADGTFKKRTNKIKNSFIDLEGTKIYFAKTKPEDYNK